MKLGTIDLELKAQPVRLSLSQRKDFKITIAATNLGDQVVDPELHRAALLVNGKPSKAWSLAIGNGKREAKWTALPPGETVSMTWSSLGDSLFPESGTYTLVLRLRDAALSPIQVQVSS